jgi:hypothetical protein
VLVALQISKQSLFKLKAKNECEIENENKDHSHDNENLNSLECINDAQNLKDVEQTDIFLSNETL